MTTGPVKWSSLTQKWLRVQVRSAPCGIERSTLSLLTLLSSLSLLAFLKTYPLLPSPSFFPTHQDEKKHLRNLGTIACHPLQSLTCYLFCLYSLPTHFMNIKYLWWLWLTGSPVSHSMETLFGKANVSYFLSPDKDKCHQCSPLSQSIFTGTEWVQV